MTRSCSQSTGSGLAPYIKGYKVDTDQYLKATKVHQSPPEPSTSMRCSPRRAFAEEIEPGGVSGGTLHAMKLQRCWGPPIEALTGHPSRPLFWVSVT
jgi:hypothetical protein